MSQTSLSVAAVPSAADLMVRDVVTISPDESLTDLERLLIEHKVSGVAVVSGAELVGIISRTDVVKQFDIAAELHELALEYYRAYTGVAGAGGVPASQQKDLDAGFSQQLAALKVSDAMVRDFVTVAPGDSILDVARTLAEHRIHRVLVTDKDRLVGIITALDVARWLASLA